MSWASQQEVVHLDFRKSVLIQLRNGKAMAQRRAPLAVYSINIRTTDFQARRPEVTMVLFLTAVEMLLVAVSCGD